MTRRMIDDSMWANERFAEMPIGARLLQIGIINHADDQGRMKANPVYLRAQIFPYDDIAPKQIKEWLDIMDANGTIILYEADGRAYLQLLNWWKYQSLQYAQPSQFPRPVGWKDRIRKTLTKGYIVTCNWQKVNGEPLEDTCDQNGNALPGRKPRKDAAGTTPDIDSADTPEQPQSTGDDSPDYSPESTPEHTIELNLTKINENIKEGNSAHAQEATPLPVSAIPPTLPISTPPQQAYRRREQVHIDGMQTRLTKFGIDARQFTAMVDSHLSAKGTKELADGDGDAADRELRAAQQFVVDLCGIGRRFHSADGINSVWDSWKTNDKRPNPSAHQLLEHASQMVAGKVTAPKPPIGNGQAQPSQLRKMKILS